jgi:hypothetical protein
LALCLRMRENHSPPTVCWTLQSSSRAERGGEGERERREEANCRRGLISAWETATVKCQLKAPVKDLFKKQLNAQLHHTKQVAIRVAQRKRGGPITHRSEDRNLALITQRQELPELLLLIFDMEDMVFWSARGFVPVKICSKLISLQCSHLYSVENYTN